MHISRPGRGGDVGLGWQQTTEYKAVIGSAGGLDLGWVFAGVRSTPCLR